MFLRDLQSRSLRGRSSGSSSGHRGCSRVRSCWCFRSLLLLVQLDLVLLLGALTLATEAADLLEPRLENADDELRGMYGALQLHAATTAARAGREGDAWRHWDAGCWTIRTSGPEHAYGAHRRWW